jgi:excisionase family DNA binding protein
VTHDGAEAFVRELARTLPEALDDEALAALAARLRPFLEPAADDRRDELLSAAQAARMANVHVETIRRAIRAGDLGIAGRVGRSPRIAPDELRRWLTKTVQNGATIRPMASRSRSPRASSRHSLRLALSSEPGDRS